VRSARAASRRSCMAPPLTVGRGLDPAARVMDPHGAV
jgi:hypothetical protein